ncbi:hypothetical protein ACM46_08195 [Chryseobacterium angstadtii]|uniref:Uncharacterized protein n=1 Tax=Chryseobacterium angstadtii TaxID=558151 RepID=A0A0J7L9Z5_9FLAO|nr:hypothetical protein [Chryseobacterium angstadtii]KMQ65820.1 hypothetical protein ACM46_08195 [Chryseobacterium angstadtii]
MKTYLLLKIFAFVIFTPIIFFAQIKVEKAEEIVNNKIVINRSITIDLSVKIDSIEVPVEKGNYKLYIPSSQLKSLVIFKKAVEYEPLKTGTDKKDGIPESSSLNNEAVAELNFKSNTKYILHIGVTGEDKKRIYIIKSESDWKWTTSFGGNAVFHTNHSRFTSVDNVVVQNRDGKTMDLMPSIMFTFMNNQKNFSPGFTGGLGYNFEELSIFAGGALGIGQNIILSAGVAVHKQNRPNTDYTVGQSIDSSVTSDNLNKMQYRVNPFVGISFRFDKNPFVAK